MTQSAPLRSRILAGETLFGTFLNLGSIQAAEVCARAGLDWVLVDLEHGAGTEADLLPQLAAIAGAGSGPALVRVEEGTPPAHRTRPGPGGGRRHGAPGQQRGRGARHRGWLRFPPAGRRGVALFTRGLAYGAGGHDSVDTRNADRSWASSRSNPARVSRRPRTSRPSRASTSCSWVLPTCRMRSASGGSSTIPTSRRPSGPSRMPHGPMARPRASCSGRRRRPHATPRSATPFFSLSTDGALLNAAIRGSLQAGRAASSSR